MAKNRKIMLGYYERKRLEETYPEMPDVFSFHEDYWTWEVNDRGYLTVVKKK